MSVLFEEYQEKMYEACHLAYAYRERAAQLVFWERLSRFLGLGIAPAIILGAVLFDNKPALAIALLVSGLLSLTSWIWTIGVTVFNLDRQLDISKEIPTKLDLFRSELRRINQQEVSSDRDKALAGVMSEVSRIRERLELEQVHVPDWMNMKAQQLTMNREKATCLSCTQKWSQNHEYSKKEIKRAIRFANKGKDFCRRCGQILPQQKGEIDERNIAKQKN